MIPKIIHYVWLGPRPFPAYAQAYVDGWKRVLPDFDFMLWNEASIDFAPLFVRQAYGARAYNRVANYARMAALQRHGGIYLDHDVELVKPFGDLLRDDCFAGFQTMDAAAGDVVNGAVIGAAPGHPFIASMLAALDGLDGALDHGTGTGPGLLSKRLRRAGPLVPAAQPILVEGVRLYPPRYFYPYAWDAAFTPECVTPDTVAIHRWAHEWKPAPTLAARAARRVFRTLARLNPTLTSSGLRRFNAVSRALG